MFWENVPWCSSSPGPAAGLFSTIGDLAAYSTALDENKLITATRYEEMTTPRLAASGKASPYAFGWMAQEFDGLHLHWAYGEGRADSALLLRVPGRGG